MKYKEVVLLLVFQSFISSCSTVPVNNPVFSGLETPRDGLAIVYLYRPKNLAGSGVRYELLLNEKRIATLPNCSFALTHLLPGLYKLSTRSRPSMSMDPDPIEFKIKEGERQFYLLDIAGSFNVIPGPSPIPLSSTNLKWRNTNENDAVRFMSDCYSVTEDES